MEKKIHSANIRLRKLVCNYKILDEIEIKARCIIRIGSQCDKLFTKMQQLKLHEPIKSL